MFSRLAHLSGVDFFGTDQVVTQSFIGGLYLDQGLEAVKQWLYPLFRPYAKAAYLIVRQQHGLPVLPTPAPSPRSTPITESDAADLGTTATMTTTTGHLALFNQHLQKSNRLVEWIYSDPLKEGNSDLNMSPEITRGMKTTPVWYVKVMVDGEFYGKGRGSNKKAARNEAAKVGLEKMGIFVW
jgi:ribonuclease III